MDGGRPLLFFFEPAKTRIPATLNPHNGYGRQSRRLRIAWESEEANSMTSARSIQLQCQKVSSATTGEQCFDFEIPMNYKNKGENGIEKPRAVDSDMVTGLKSMSMPFSSTNGTTDTRMVRFSVDQCFEHIQLSVTDIVSCAYKRLPPPTNYSAYSNAPHAVTRRHRPAGHGKPTKAEPMKRGRRDLQQH